MSTDIHMIHWKTSRILELLSNLPNSPKITVERPGGDVDTETVIVRNKDGEALWIAGFRTDDVEMADPSDVDVEMVEVSDGQDSGGGFNSDNEDLGILYGIVCSRLRKAGFIVVRQMKDYF